MNTRFQKKIWIGLALVAGLIIVGCGSNSSAESTSEEIAASKELYTCGMHPNVIQEGPGNCPICGMKLTPLNGGAATTSTAATSSTGEKKILYWQAPMDPSYISPKPGKSPMGMDLIPVYEGEEAFGSTVKINPVTEQNMGVRIAKVTRRDLTKSIRTVASIETDESRVAHVHTKISGWVEKTFVSTTGEHVTKGQELLEIYSPQLVTAQQEYLDAYHNFQSLSADVDPILKQNMLNILRSARTRLEYFDISEDQIHNLETSGKTRKTLVIRSPYNGFVITKHVLDGMEVKPGMVLYTLADLSALWIQAEIYESELPWVKEGQQATITLPYFPGESFTGVLDYIYPILETKSRTIKVRLVVPNPDLRLKPGMYANVTIHANPVKNAIAVPQEAVLFSGERTLVFMSLGNGRFAPRDVTVGIESGDNYYEIREGLKAGEAVVLSGQFLLDSESRLQEGIAKMLADREAAKTGTLTPEKSADETTPKKTKAPKMDMNMEMDGSMKMDKGMDMDDHQHTHSEEAGKLPFGTVQDGNLTFYTCPMESHSFVKVAEPGKCPECGMDLIKKTIPVDENATWYTCPMDEHSFVVTDTPGDCPECGMTLVPLTADE